VIVHEDNDVSAYSGKVRPGYAALLADLEAGRADAVLAWHTDRLHRSPLELEHYIDVCEKADAVTHTVKAGELDLSTASGRMVARMLGAAARHESEQKSERTRRAQQQAAEAGKWLGGARPFGWQMRDGGAAVLDRAEARVVRKAAEQLLAGASLGSVVDGLNTRGVTTSTGRPWNYTSLRQVLTRPRNAGLSTFGGEIVGATTWPPILTEDTWRAVTGLLTDPTRRRSASNRLRWMLAGLALCPCGSTVRTAMVASNRAAGTTRTVYRCRERGPGHVARAAVPVDGFVAALVVARLSRRDARDLLRDDERPDAETLRNEAMALRARIVEAGDMFADGEMTRVQLERITSRVQRQLDDVEDRMATSARGSVLVDLVQARDAGAVWDRLSTERRRSVVDALMTVTLLPSGRRGKAFDPELVRIEWRTT
jgi:site-specific DNA recombinase